MSALFYPINQKVIGIKPDNAFVKAKGIKEFIYPAKQLDNNSEEFVAKMRLSPELDRAMLVGKFLHNKPDDGRHPEAIGGWDTYKTIFRLNDLFFSGEIKVMLTQHGRVFHGVSQIKKYH